MAEMTFKRQSRLPAIINIGHVDFLLEFNCSYVLILYRFRDTASLVAKSQN